MHPFIFLPIALYFTFLGLFVQQGLTLVFFRRQEHGDRLKNLTAFTFGAATLCAALLLVILSPQLGFTPDGTRLAFFICWLVAPAVGLLYTLTLSEHLRLKPKSVNWIVRGYKIDFCTTLACGVYTLTTGRPALFAHGPSDTQSFIQNHLGGSFSPNAITELKACYISVLVLLSAAFFIREVYRRKPIDFSLLAGIILTAISLVAELFFYLLQAPAAFSILPLANAVEILRLTYLDTLKTGRSIEQSALELRRKQVNLESHLAALSHDVRTPLTSLKLGLSRLQDEDASSNEMGKLADGVEYLHVAFSNLSTLVQIELSGARLTTITGDIRQMLAGLKPRFEPLVSARGVTIEVSSESEALRLNHDPLAFEQSMGNLTYNAIMLARAHAAVTVSKTTDHIIIRFLDDGPPVGHIDMQRLADPTYRRALEHRLGCTGWALCLAIAVELITLHGGHIELGITIPNANCVTVTLPNADPHRSDVKSSLETPSKDSAGNWSMNTSHRQSSPPDETSRL
ncbi:MAG: HAMP domain-containing sensor histidine kinase [Myxococcota bacterium]|nr:HAMP domain-containing sensor histidine kinase [Myxococcota bacterium]